MNIDTPAYSSLDLEDQIIIMAAIETICTNNPHAATQLNKLAEMKNKNPLQWKMGLKFLKLPG